MILFSLLIESDSGTKREFTSVSKNLTVSCLFDVIVKQMKTFLECSVTGL